MRPKSTFRCRQSGLYNATLKTEVDFVPRGADFRCDLRTEVDLSCRTGRTFRCDMKTEVDFVPRGADFDTRL
jgi:hypothetical protein